MLSLYEKGEDKPLPYQDLHCRQFPIASVIDVYQTSNDETAIFTIENGIIYVYIYGGHYEFLRINYDGWFAPRFATKEDLEYVNDWIALLPHTGMLSDYYQYIDSIFDQNIFCMAYKGVVYPSKEDYKFMFGADMPEKYLEGISTENQECYNYSSYHVRIFRDETNDLYHDDKGDPLPRFL
ncbi:hypothetical protein [uncultured Bacteroides sp.]|uniref:hypothetical protein n=1 Tax=uncultured Bacteroides sp. TaxID=162156 RepID=UPI002636E54B|nr:hypothetical protein [uncultured Bacteroides sp.]